MSWNERELHLWMRTHLSPSGLAGAYGNDAAVLARSVERPVLCVDQVLEGVHYEPGTRAADVGHKACARALSDLAASAAVPRAVLLSLALGPEVDGAWVRRLVGAVARSARSAGAELVGGDLSSAPSGVAVSVAALGSARRGRRPVGRERARPGQALVATGPFGGSALGRHLRIAPRLAEGRWLAERGATAMMDVSDGLALDLERLAEASGVRLELEHVPLHRDARRAARASGRTALEHALGDGEDHELVATVPLRALIRLGAEAREKCRGFAVLGRVRVGEGLWISGAEGEFSRAAGKGWIHGA